MIGEKPALNLIVLRVRIRAGHWLENGHIMRRLSGNIKRYARPGFQITLKNLGLYPSV